MIPSMQSNLQLAFEVYIPAYATKVTVKHCNYIVFQSSLCDGPRLFRSVVPTVHHNSIFAEHQNSHTVHK